MYFSPRANYIIQSQYITRRERQVEIERRIVREVDRDGERFDWIVLRHLDLSSLLVHLSIILQSTILFVFLLSFLPAFSSYLSGYPNSDVPVSLFSTHCRKDGLALTYLGGISFCQLLVSVDFFDVREFRSIPPWTNFVIFILFCRCFESLQVSHLAAWDRHSWDPFLASIILFTK